MRLEKKNITKKITFIIILATLILTLITGCNRNIPTTSKTQEPESVELVISAASSLTDVTAEIAKRYKKEAPHVTLTFTYGGSGALQTQIEEGAPIDIFMSAAQKQMNVLIEKGYIQKETSIDLLSNKLVLIVPKKSTLDIQSFLDLITDKVDTIALGDPSSVPAGQYAQEVFTKLGYLDGINQKINYGTDVRQVLTWVETNESDCGVVYASDAMTTKKVRVVCEAPKELASPIIYPVSILKNSSNPKAAKGFIDYLQTEEIQQLFESYGFEKVEEK